VGTIRCLGLRGDDGEGFELNRALAARSGVDLSGFVAVPGRNTFTYTKPLLHRPGQPPEELNRLDLKNFTPTPAEAQEAVIAAMDRVAADPDGADAWMVMDQVDLAEKDFDALHWCDDTQAYYNLDSGYGPVWVCNAAPPVEAIAGLIAAYMHGETEVDIEAHPGHTVITIGALSVKAPPLRFGSGAESIPTLVARMTADKFEVEFLAEPKAAAYAIGYNSAGFWHWFARCALSAGLRALYVSERNPDTLTLLLDPRCCSGDDGSSWRCGVEPLVP